MFISKNEYKRIMGLIESNKKEIQNFKQEISTNGVANDIAALKGEVFMDKKERKSDFGYPSWMSIMWGLEASTRKFEPTLKAKVDAIIAHLGINIETELVPSTKEGTRVKITKKEVKKAIKKVTKKTNRKK